jgi:hypothetical protein
MIISSKIFFSPSTNSRSNSGTGSAVVLFFMAGNLEKAVF